MGVYRRIAGSSSQIFAVAIWDMFTGFRIAEPLSKPEVNYVDVVLLLADTDQEVVGFDVSVQKVARVHELNSLKLNRLKLNEPYHLVCKH